MHYDARNIILNPLHSCAAGRLCTSYAGSTPHPLVAYCSLYTMAPGNNYISNHMPISKSVYQQFRVLNTN